MAQAAVPDGFQKGPRPDAWVETMSWKPRAFVWHGFLSDDEADHIIKVAEPKMKRSSVINYDGSVTPEDNIRTSYGTFLDNAQDDVIRDIDLRVAAWTRLPPSHSESMQVLRYEFNQTYGGHWDELDPTFDPHTVGGGSPRTATVLMYLSDTEEGGETAFPHSLWINKAVQTEGVSFSDCTNGGVAVKPTKGDALLFWGLKVNVSRLEPFSFHTGCPVIKGIKWTAVKWIHTKDFVNPTLYGKDMNVNDDNHYEDAIKKEWREAQKERTEKVHECVDRDSKCKEWAEEGKCETNAVFMMGDSNYEGRCVKSCGACCLPADVLCERALRARRIELGLERS